MFRERGWLNCVNAFRSGPELHRAVSKIPSSQHEPYFAALHAAARGRSPTAARSRWIPQSVPGPNRQLTFVR